MRTDSGYAERVNAIEAKMKDEGTIPSYTKPRATLLNRKRRRPKQRAFLKAYGRLVHIGLAAKAAHIHESTHRAWLRKDRWYARLFDQIKRKVSSNPPATRVRKKKNLRRPVGVGWVKPRSYGCMVEWYGTDPDGQRRARRERLENVSEADARRYVLERVKADPPKRGPLRYGHFPSIESLLHPNYEQVPKTALSITKPPGRRNRPVGMGSIHLNKNSVAITWFDTQRQRHYENLGPVSIEEAQAILDKRTAADRQKRQQAREVARQFLRSKSTTVAKSAPRSRGGRPPGVSADVRKRDQEATFLSPRKWCEVRDAIGIPLTPTVKKFGSWVKAYDSRDADIRQYLMEKKAAKKKEAQESAPKTDPYENPA